MWEGCAVGSKDAEGDGVGWRVGFALGWGKGALLGFGVGRGIGILLGACVGWFEGSGVGTWLGIEVGAAWYSAKPPMVVASDPVHGLMPLESE